MRLFQVCADRLIELSDWPQALPAEGFLWLGFARSEFESGLAELQQSLQRWSGGQLVDLHISDLLNKQLTSHYDYTSWYDLMVFRRLSAAGAVETPAAPASPSAQHVKTGDAAAPPNAPVSIETSAVGFAVFDQVLVTVHAEDCAVRDFMAQRLASLADGAEARGAGRLPTSPADLMLRMLNHMVDGYLELRRQLTRQLGHLQQQLLDPRSRFKDWQMVLDARTALHQLEDIGEDQRGAVQEWIEALDEWPDDADRERQHARELLRVRSRDVLEHVERVLSHVRRLEHSAETAVQMHFSALGHRTNDIMRTLTVLTATFLPLNLITGFFGMNFEFLPLIHSRTGLWIAMVAMLVVGVTLLVYFRRKRYLGTSRA